MLVSTFELLVKPQFPTPASTNLPPTPPIPPKLANLSRTVIQGYFLTLANVTNTPANVALGFTAVTPSVNIEQTFTALDSTVIGRANLIGDVTPDPTIPGGIRARFNNLSIAANDTIQFILQPDIIRDDAKLLEQPEFELRGYVEIFLTPIPTAPARTISLLVNPEQRGTFFKGLSPGVAPQLDQIIYNLPTPTGGSLFTLTAT